MLNINVLDGLFGAFFEAAFGKGADALEKRNAFKQDLNDFLSNQLRLTRLEVFLFSRHKKLGEDENAEDFLPLDEIYIPLRLTQMRGTLPDFQALRKDPERHKGLREQKIENIDISKLLAFMDGNEFFRSVMIIGTAGSGKSTFMKYLTQLFSQEKREVKVLDKKNENDPKEKKARVKLKALPIFVRLRDLEAKLLENGKADWEKTYSLKEFIAAQHGQPLRSSDFFLKLFQKFPCLFLFDGIDEIAEDKKVKGIPISRKRVINWLLDQMKHLQSQNPEARFILTSRPTDTGPLVRHFQIFEAEKFDQAEISLFTEYWYRGCEKTFQANAECEIVEYKREKWQKRCERLSQGKKSFLQNAQRDPLKTIIENPLLLSLALYMHVIEERFSVENREKLYERFCEAFLYEWDEVRDMDFFPELFGRGNYERLYEVTCRLALHFSLKNTTVMQVRDILPALQNAISRYKLPIDLPMEERALDLLRAFDNRNGLLSGKSNSDDFQDTEFEFQHKSFQDYLAAQCIKHDDLIAKGTFSFEDKLAEDFWQRSIEFYINLGSPDVFFAKTIAAISPGSPVAQQLHFFTQHFLNAPQKDPELESRLSEKTLQVFLESRDEKEIFIASQCLGRLEVKEESSLWKLVETRHSDDLEAFRAGKAVWLLAKKGKYEQLRPLLAKKMTAMYAQPQPADFMELSQWQVLIFSQKDKPLIHHFFQYSHGEGGLVVLLDLLDLRDLGDLLDSPDLRYLRFLRDLLDLLDLRDLRDLLDLRDLRDLRDFRNFRNFRNLRNLRGLRVKLSSSKVDFGKITPYLERSLHRLENLSAEEEARYFKPYPPIALEG